MIKTCSPEEKRIPAEYILSFVKTLEKHCIPVHSFILYKDDSIISEKYYAPYKKGDLHRLFSVSKSVTALAIGMLADSGKLSLDDKIIDYFPEKVPTPTHPWLAEMTIRDMLMMRTCHAQSTYNKFDLESDWVGSFFTKLPTHKSGTVFHYDTSAAHVLAALTERLTGMPMWDYFRMKLSELELSADSYMLKDGHGVSMGGTGLVATPQDMLKIGILLLNKGEYNGKQLISEKYITEATSYLTPNCIAAPLPSEGSGYGYMIWRTERNGFVCYGMGGQLIIVQPEHRMILVTTCDTQGLSGANQMIYNAFYDEILDKLTADCSDTYVTKHIAESSTDNARISDFYKRFSESDAITYIFTDGYGVPLKVEGNSIFTSMKLLSDKMIFFSGDKAYEFPFSFSGYEEALIKDYNLKCYCNATLPDMHTLYIKATIIDSCVGSIHFQLFFGDNDVVVYIKKIEETLLTEYNGHFYGVKNET